MKCDIKDPHWWIGASRILWNLLNLCEISQSLFDGLRATRSLTVPIQFLSSYGTSSIAPGTIYFVPAWSTAIFSMFWDAQKNKKTRHMCRAKEAKMCVPLNSSHSHSDKSMDQKLCIKRLHLQLIVSPHNPSCLGKVTFVRREHIMHFPHVFLPANRSHEK